MKGRANKADSVQAGYQYGFNNLLTLYGGSMVANNYYVFTLGRLEYTLWAISVDATKSHSKQATAMCLTGKVLNC
ncbi:fimbria/pilus outer membrane usher protein [Shigella flexneri]